MANSTIRKDFEFDGIKLTAISSFNDIDGYCLEVELQDDPILKQKHKNWLEVDRNYDRVLLVAAVIFDDVERIKHYSTLLTQF